MFLLKKKKFAKITQKTLELSRFPRGIFLLFRVLFECRAYRALLPPAKDNICSHMSPGGVLLAMCDVFFVMLKDTYCHGSFTKQFLGIL